MALRPSTWAGLLFIFANAELFMLGKFWTGGREVFFVLSGVRCQVQGCAGTWRYTQRAGGELSLRFLNEETRSL